MAVGAKSKTKKSKKIISPNAKVNITSTFNNTMITFSTMQGDVIAWSSTGKVGFKGTRKGTPYAAQVAAEEVSNRVKEMGVESVLVFVKGPGAGRDSSLRAINSVGLRITRIEDVTPIPHNGCRPPSKRRP